MIPERTSRRERREEIPEQQSKTPLSEETQEETVWNSEPKVREKINEYQKRIRSTGVLIVACSSAFIEEGANQYRSSYAGSKNAYRSGHQSLKEALLSVWGFLTQPVWVVGRKKEPKEYSRITLFVLDTVRFGGTFAAIFGILFASLNYQSFWKIVSTRLDPIQYTVSINAEANDIHSALREKLMRSPSLAVAGKEGDVLSFLPSVGPPENRIIIPKLGLNVPLVTPSYESLLREDWEEVENDIQEALAMGIVHYPGTARPGQAGNFFVTGHSSYYPWAPGKYKTVFARLGELEVGDEYWVYYGGDKHRYVVREKKEVKPTDVTVLDQPTSKRVSTLMTCVPVGTTLRRLIISSEEIDPVTGIVLAVGERETQQKALVQTQMLPI